VNIGHVPDPNPKAANYEENRLIYGDKGTVGSRPILLKKSALQ
jgi:hypothetical protein